MSDSKPSLLKREPALITGGLTSLLAAALTIGSAAGLTLPATVQTGLYIAVAVLGPLLAVLRTRGLVFSPATWAKAQNDLDAVTRALTDAESEINGHGDALGVVEATVVSALNELLRRQTSAPLTVTVGPPSTAQAPAQAPVTQPTQAWSTSQNGPWSSYPPGSVSGTAQMTAVQPPVS